MKALGAIGYGKAFRFSIWPLVYGVFRLIPYPHIRTLYLRMWGAEIGSNCIIHDIKFFNFYRGSFRNLKMGNDCFLGNDVLLDLAAPIQLSDQVTIAERSIVLTHSNVGYADHPLQKFLPSKTAGVEIGSGCFIGANCVILCGVKIGVNAAIGSSSLVDSDIPPRSLSGGVPARLIRKLE
jgi:acetyltransferase-like isoleucine patch superfamily enzyme